MTSPTYSYGILEDGILMDGEIYPDEKALFAALPYAEHDARVMQFDFPEFIRDGATNVRDVTEELVYEAYNIGVLTRDDKIAWANLDLPETRDEAAGNRADAEWAGAA